MEILYRYLFWTGYLSVIIISIIPVNGGLTKITIGSESFHLRIDFLLHFTVFFLIALYYLFGDKINLTLFTIKPELKFLILGLLLGIVTETLQLWVPVRTFNLFDLIANMMGFLSGIMLIHFIKNKCGHEL